MANLSTPCHVFQYWWKILESAGRKPERQLWFTAERFWLTLGASGASQRLWKTEVYKSNVIRTSLRTLLDTRNAGQ
ncbi:predicted protein [Sclerotinia sclerotiorum 1980 UF-70]|uniref:Uncharacterized protein n=1 Tax=Sclerotinia sclerotiorum (strain ATCC 18683 / 1980 / Ss-1) TaxID=665079 RepID=A7EKV8_SCLS1|nr:predicted protein [Sclerotinia sclerotiorum 1980 UF-70]EDO03474.1 predicted protein [Sclerotinia sclerotiorum 1980 UF-70]